jgi:hypothetical protein
LSWDATKIKLEFLQLFKSKNGNSILTGIQCLLLEQVTRVGTAEAVLVILRRFLEGSVVLIEKI